MGEDTCFEVTIQSGLLPAFRVWLDSLDMTMVAFGPNEAGTPTYVTTIKPGSALERRFLAMKRGEPDG